MTQAATSVRAAIGQAFPGLVTFGRKNCRPIGSGSTWSQHAFYGPGHPDSNALDIHAANQAADLIVQQAVLDVVFEWIQEHNAPLILSDSGKSYNASRIATADGRQGLGIKRAIWRQPAHYDHIHIDFWPHGIRRSSCGSTYTATFRRTDGVQIGTIDPQWEGALPDEIVPPDIPGHGDDEVMTKLPTLKYGDDGEQTRRLQALLALDRKSVV